MPKKKVEVEASPALGSEEKAEVKSVDLSSLVNGIKKQRAERAVNVGCKPDSAEFAVLRAARAENPKATNDELVLAVYKGLGGLVNGEKAARNRQNEARAKKARESL